MELTQEKKASPVNEKHQVKEKAQPYVRKHGGDKNIAILVHGFTGSPYDMRELADFLYSHDIDVAVARIAGHGTHIKDLMETKYEHWYESVERFAEEVTGNSKRAYLVGYSFGSNIILDLAYRHPGRFKGVVCLGPSIYWHKRAYYKVLYTLFKIIHVHKVKKPYVRRHQVTEWESTGNYAEFPTYGLGEFRDVITSRTKKILSGVKTPTLIIHSRGDRISHPRSSDYLFEHLGSEYKEMFVLPDLNHNPLRSENKDKIFQRVLGFIQA